MSSLEILQSRSQIIETFLGRQFPLHKIFEALAASMPDVYFDALNKSKATVQVQRQSLDVLTDAELNHRYDKMLADDKASALASAAAAAIATAKTIAKHEAKATAKEAARFYNQPNAQPNFAHWCDMEYWTFDEAIALLLGRNPTVLTATALKRELSKSVPLMLFPEPEPRPAFLIQYEALCHLARRATPMSGQRLKPLMVVAWAAQTGTFGPPAELVRLLTARALAVQPSMPSAVSQVLPKHQMVDERGAAENDHMPVKAASFATQPVEGLTEIRVFTTHSTKGSRRDILTPIVEAAQAKCRSPFDAAEVWTKLMSMAQSKESPLLGVTEDGIQYSHDGEASYLSLNAVRQRLKRAAEKRR